MANRKPLTNNEAQELEESAVIVPDPELIDDDNPEWTDEMIARAVPFSGLPQELQYLLSEPKHIKPDADSDTPRQPAA